jgi:hypothetical protein
MIIFITNDKISPTALSWEEKNSGDYSYKPIDTTKIDKFFEDFNKGVYSK